jgi:indolepyruvate ferredoxin oxidoreductase
VKERNLAAAKRKEAELVAAFHADGPLTRAA